MVNGLLAWVKNKYLLIIFSFIFFSCSQTTRKTKNNKDFKKLVSGDLVCRLGNGLFSGYFKKYASNDQKFSHMGVLSRENDSLFVYHSEASEFTGVGDVRRELLSVFLDDIETFGFYKLNFKDAVISKILGQVKYYHSIKVPFDMDFNSSNDKELYCTELIATSINNVLNDSVVKPTMKLNGRILYALDDIYRNENVKEISLAK